MNYVISGILFLASLTCAVAEVFNWKAATTGDWSSTGNWVDGVVPGADAEVVITNPGSVAILSGSTPALQSVLVKGTLIFTNWDTTLNAASVIVTNGGQVTHYLNTDSNAPWVPNNRVVISCSNLTVHAGGFINTDGKGYTVEGVGKPSYGPGAGSGYASGAGHGGAGGMTLDSESVFRISQVYGDPFTPTNPGSAGGNHQSNGLGGNGGGAIVITATGEVRVDGTISANGANYVPSYGAGGAGGSVLILCNTLAGSGAIKARGGAGVISGATGAHGGGGRISLRYSAAQSNVVDQPLVLLDAGMPTTTPSYASDMGTIWLPDTLLMRESLTNLNGQVFGFNAWSPGRIAATNNRVRFQEDGFQLRVTNGILVSGANGSLEFGRGRMVGSRLYSSASNGPCAVETGGDLVLTNGGTMRLFSTATNGLDYAATLSITGQLAVCTNGTLFLFSDPTNGGSALVRCGRVTVLAGGLIEADGKGYGNIGLLAGGTTYTNMGVGPGFWGPNSGGSHGGGGSVAGGTIGQTVHYEDVLSNLYGSTTNPIAAGSTGGRHLNTHARVGNDGGGVVRIETTGSVFVAGIISANGWDATGDYDGAGAGGSVNIRCRTLAGNGVVRANGGSAKSTQYGGGGGGGRIAVSYATGDQSALGPQGLSFSARPGTHPAGSYQNCVGDVGSLWFPDNFFLASPLLHSGEWCVEDFTEWAVGSLTVSNQWFRFGQPNFALTVTNSLTVVGTTSLWHRLELSNGWVTCGQLEARRGRVGLLRSAQGGSRLTCTGEVLVNRGWVGVVSGGTNVMLESGSLVLTNSGLLLVEAAATNPAVADQGGLVRVAGLTTIATGSFVRPLCHGINGGAVKFILGDLKVDAFGGFDATAAGYGERGNTNANRGTGPGRGLDYGGGGHGALGGSAAGIYGQVYGLTNAPIAAGSSGGKHTSFWRPYNHGGGVIRIQAQRVTLDGTLKADGGNTGGQSYGGGGSGGSILLQARMFAGGSGTLSVRGGNGSTDASEAGGAGGRVALWLGGFSDQDEETLLAGQMTAKTAFSTNWNVLVGTAVLEGGKNSTATPRPGGTGTFVALTKPFYTGTLMLVR
jgi:hypothetical protein